jgi:surfactin family lipopeptide synthetase A
MDGISLELFIQQLRNAFVVDEYEENTLQFKDYTEWLQKNENDTQAISFFKNYLTSYQIKESISVDVLSNQTTNKGASYITQFSKECTNTLHELAKQQEVSTYQLVVTIINSIIHITSEHTDIVVGTIHSGRHHADIAGLIGMFVKTLPLRTKLDKNDVFEDVLAITKEQLILLDEYQEIPLSVIQENLFDLLVTYQKPDFSYQEEMNIGDLTLTYVPVETAYSRVPLLLNFFELNDHLNLTISYNTDMYEESTAIFITELFEKIVKEVVANSSIDLVALKGKVYNNSSTQVDFDFNF